MLLFQLRREFESYYPYVVLVLEAGTGSEEALSYFSGGIILNWDGGEGGRVKGVYPTYAKLIITTINGNHLKAAIYSDALQSSECNRVHLHIVFVLLYSVCRSVSVFFACRRHSIFYVCFTCCYFGRH